MLDCFFDAYTDNDGRGHTSHETHGIHAPFIFRSYGSASIVARPICRVYGADDVLAQAQG